MKTYASRNTEHLRVKHNEALKRICRHEDVDGLTLWRRLRRVECLASSAATAQCNGERYNGQPYRDEEAWEAFKGQIASKVEKILGWLPTGFFVNGDPRGYALKLEPGSVQADLHEDWGRYQILAPEIN